MSGLVEVRTVVERKAATLPRFVVIPARAVAHWHITETITVDVRMNGIDVGRHSLVPWDDKKWFIGISQKVCDATGIDTGVRVTIRISRSDSALPAELQTLIDANPRARTKWSRLTAAQQRMLRENVAAAKKAETRQRRAERELLTD